MYEKYVKRIIDFVFAVILLIILLPFMFFVALAIKIEDPTGSIFFKQKRPGKNAEIFDVYKFRSMREETEVDGRKLTDTERMTKVGSFLRKTSIDELPQIFNIILGEMSFIGPRPLAIRYLPYYTKEENRRHDVLPGISGLAQIKGRNTLTWQERFFWDIYYVDNISFFLDCKIFLYTIVKIFRRDDIVVKDENSLKDLDVERGEKIEFRG